MRKTILNARRAPFFSVAALICIAPCAFSAPTHGALAPTGNSEVLVILNDFQDATLGTESASSAFAGTSSTLTAPLSTAAGSHLVSLASLDSDGKRPRRHVDMSEAGVAFNWAIDLAGVAALVFFLRRRSANSKA